jgi:Telomere resolvase
LPLVCIKGFYSNLSPVLVDKKHPTGHNISTGINIGIGKKKMVNVFYLTNGENFVINPALEVNPNEARDSKKVFLLGLNIVDLSTDKLWTAKAISALATGMVTIKDEGKKRATKAVLIDRLKDYVTEERLAASVVDDNLILYAKQTLQDCSLSPERLQVLIETLVGQDLVDGIAALIMAKNYAPSTIVKTILPDVAKLITAGYKGEDGQVVKGSLYARFKTMRDLVHKDTNLKVVEACNNRVLTEWEPLSTFVSNVFSNVETSTWKHLSFAIGLATGRRMSEVHGMDTVFEVVSEDTLIFEGQLKTKSREDVGAYEIPTLFPATQVYQAWLKLRELGKASLTPQDVNKKLSKALSTEMPKDIQDIKKQSNLLAYKDLRDCYAAFCHLKKPETMSTNAYLSKIMGHGENDLETASTYDKRGIKV